MEGYIHGLMAVYHARLLRSLSCVLGAHTRERDRVCGYEREKGKGDKQCERKEERVRERERGRREQRKKERERERGKAERTRIEREIGRDGCRILYLHVGTVRARFHVRADVHRYDRTALYQHL